MKPLPLNSSVCVISARRYGDAIMNAAILKQAAIARPDIQWIIWTKPDFVALFKLMGFEHIITAQFPIAGGHKKLLNGGWKMLASSVIQLRKLKIDASIDFIGDAREAFFGAIINSKNHYSPKWGDQHWMRNLIWNIPVVSVNYLPIASNDDQVYKFIPDLLSKILGISINAESKPHPFIPNPNPKIAFHPFSSQSFKRWPTANWEALAERLSKDGLDPIILCSKPELKEAQLEFSHSTCSLPIHSCASIEDLIEQINTIDLLIGVDSFLVHLASALGKRTIVINTGNKPHWWQPPNSIALGQSGDCPSYPCMNEPICLGKVSESSCVKSITPDSVFKAVGRSLPTDSLSNLA